MTVKQVTDYQLSHSFNRIDRARGDISLTYFEFGTLAALDIFRNAEPDIVILEVGLGGRLDAVNILDADIALVVTIDLESREVAGLYPGKHRQGKSRDIQTPVPGGVL